MPRKTNRAAARTVASGDVFWDKRKVASKARRGARQMQLVQASCTGAHSLGRRQELWVSNHLPAWSWDGVSGALKAPAQATQQQLDELVAVTRLPFGQRAVLKIQGLCLEQIRYVAERAPRTALFILVDPLTTSQQTIRVPRFQ